MTQGIYVNFGQHYKKQEQANKSSRNWGGVVVNNNNKKKWEITAKLTNKEHSVESNSICKLKAVKVTLSQFEIYLTKPSLLLRKSQTRNLRTQNKDGETKEEIMCELIEFGKEVRRIKTITEMKKNKQQKVMEVLKEHKEQKLMKI